MRLERGLSQREVCAGLERFGAAYLSRIEADERTPSLRALRQVAEKLGVTLHYLERGTERADGRNDTFAAASAELAEVIALVGEAEERLARLQHRLRAAEDELA